MNLNNTPAGGRLTEADLDKLIASTWLKRRVLMVDELKAVAQVRDRAASRPQPPRPGRLDRVSALTLLLASVYVVVMLAGTVAMLFPS